MPAKYRTPQQTPVLVPGPAVTGVAIGDRHGRWTINSGPLIGVLQNGRRVLYFECLCDCGTVKPVQFRNMKSGATISCGCYKRQHTGERARTHGDCKSLIYQAWEGMKHRCRTKFEPHYSAYGKRGIRVCREWVDDYPAFREWAVANGFQPGLTLERNDNNRGYEPSNCTWIPKSMQCRNLRTNRKITAFGETKLQVEWLADPRCVVGQTALSRRIRDGWGPEEAIETPVGLGKRKYRIARPEIS